MRLLAVLLMACGTAHAGDWQSKDTALLGGALGLLAIDWAQTRDLVRQQTAYYSSPACADSATRSQPLAGACPVGYSPTYHEINPLLPAHPTAGQVNKYFAVAMIGTAGLSYALPTKYRYWFLGGVVVLESVVVLNNHRLGLRISF